MRKLSREQTLSVFALHICSCNVNSAVIARVCVKPETQACHREVMCWRFSREREAADWNEITILFFHDVLIAPDE